MNTMKSLHTVAFALVVTGGVNWGLVGLMNYNLVNMLVGSWPMLEQLVYVLVGLSAVYEVATHKTNCKNCSAGKGM